MRKGVATAAILARALHHSRSLPPSPLPTEGLPTRVPSSLKTTKPKSNDDSPLLLHSSHPHLVFLISFPHLVFLRRRRFKRICHSAAATISQRQHSLSQSVRMQYSQVGVGYEPREGTVLTAAHYKTYSSASAVPLLVVVCRVPRRRAVASFAKQPLFCCGASKTQRGSA